MITGTKIQGGVNNTVLLLQQTEKPNGRKCAYDKMGVQKTKQNGLEKGITASLTSGQLDKLNVLVYLVYIHELKSYNLGDNRNLPFA